MSAPLSSMTGFGRSEGGDDASAWIWELRCVNGRGLELRFRLPPGCDSLEPALREAAGRVLRRGSVNATLNIRREQTTTLAVDPAALDRALTLALELAARIPGAPAPRAEALLALPGVLVRSNPESDAAGFADSASLLAGFQAALDALIVSRRAEGARLSALMTGLLGELSALHRQASAEAADQPAAQRTRMLDAVQSLLRSSHLTDAGLPQERVAQEVALLAARSDVREELDRLTGHIEAAHALLAEGAVIGRRFDFLVQEFVREVNTLCSKSASSALTVTGLRLKATVEQMREQVQNIE